MGKCFTRSQYALMIYQQKGYAKTACSLYDSSLWIKYILHKESVRSYKPLCEAKLYAESHNLRGWLLSNA